jgi:hypothetical protein
MQAQIVLTPAESKKLIAHAVLKLPKVCKALCDGIVVLHPSSTTVFIYEELFGKQPEGLWVCGTVAPCGLTGSREAEEMIRARGPGAHNPLNVSRQSWLIERGVLKESVPLGEILDKMGEGDIYVKGEKIDEIDAIFILSGAKAVQIAAGGLGGAEGAVILAIDGDDAQVENAYNLAMKVKGAKLPVLNLVSQSK